MMQNPNEKRNSDPPEFAAMMQSPPSTKPIGARIHAHGKPRPLRKKNQIPSGGMIIAGMPIAIQSQLTLRRGSGVSSSGVPRIAATMLTELTFIEAMTTVMNVITTPRQ